MSNPLRLIAGQAYRVTKPFVDYDEIDHEVGETWTFQTANFLPYDDGLTLHVLLNGRTCVYRLQWRAEEQTAIIENFNDYVEAC